MKAVSYYYTFLMMSGLFDSNAIFFVETDAINGINGTIITYGQVCVAFHTCWCTGCICETTAFS